MMLKDALECGARGPNSQVLAKVLAARGGQLPQQGGETHPTGVPEGFRQLA